MVIKKVLAGLVIFSIALSVNASACPKAHGKKQCYSKSESSTVSRVIKAVSKTGLSAAQTRKIAEGIAEYEVTTKKISKMKIFAVDSFINEEFDEKKFIGEMSEKYIATVAARAALYKYVFAVLDKEQRKIFKREYAAPMIKEMIQTY